MGVDRLQESLPDHTIVPGLLNAMSSSPRLASQSTVRLEFGRRGLAPIVFAILRPGDARAATVKGYALTLTLPWRSVTLPVKEIETVEVSEWWGVCGTGRLGDQDRDCIGSFTGRGHSLGKTLEAARECAGGRRRLGPQPTRFVPSMCASPSWPTRPATPPGKPLPIFGAKRPPWRAGSRRFGRTQSRATPRSAYLKRVRTFLNDPERLRIRANETYITNELRRSRAFFDTVEAHPLTDEQRRAVVVDETCNLVIASAGSGKTSVIVAKAGWLLRRGYRQASSCSCWRSPEMPEQRCRSASATGLAMKRLTDITVQTFHQLGKSIIGHAEGKSPTLAKVAEDRKALFDLLKDIVSDLLANPNVSAILLNWFQDKFAPYRSEHEFHSFGEYWDYIRRYEIRSLQGEKVKSFEECEIANFLYLNGVPYEYERAYEVETATADKQQYQPDFYLTEARIYLEHFAVTASGDTPAFIDRDEYLSGMEVEAASPRRTRHHPDRDVQPRGGCRPVDRKPCRKVGGSRHCSVSDPFRRSLWSP